MHRKEDLIIGKIKDLTGQKFGKLIALEPTDQKRNKSVVWKCRCECGNIVYATSRNLQIGDIKSCGCTNFVIKDLIGKQFGNLTVIKDSGKRKSGNVFWECKCSCGNIDLVLGYSLTNGVYTMCKQCRHPKKIKVKKEKIDRTCKYALFDDYGICTTYNGVNYLFDIEDYEKIKKYNWTPSTDGYASTTYKRKHIPMHRLVMGCDDESLVVDHINHDINDNRKNNLRIVTFQQNAMNRLIYSNNTSGVTGVSWSNRDQVWVACITYKYKTIRLGCYTNFDDAVSARKKAEKKYFGEYACKN